MRLYGTSHNAGPSTYQSSPPSQKAHSRAPILCNGSGRSASAPPKTLTPFSQVQIAAYGRPATTQLFAMQPGATPTLCHNDLPYWPLWRTTGCLESATSPYHRAKCAAVSRILGERAESVDIVNTSEAPLKRPYATLCDLGGTLFPPGPRLLLKARRSACARTARVFSRLHEFVEAWLLRLPRQQWMKAFEDHPGSRVHARTREREGYPDDLRRIRPDSGTGARSAFGGVPARCTAAGSRGYPRWRRRVSLATCSASPRVSPHLCPYRYWTVGHSSSVRHRAISSQGREDHTLALRPPFAALSPLGSVAAAKCRTYPTVGCGTTQPAMFL